MSARFEVAATPAPTTDLDVSVSYAEQNLTESHIILAYPPVTTTVTINEGSSSTTLTVTSIDDSDVDGPGAIHAWLNRGSGYRTDHDDDTSNRHRTVAIVSVLDDDESSSDSVLSITSVKSSVSEGTAVKVTITATPPPTAVVTIGYRMSETGSTLTPSIPPSGTTGTVTMNAGQRTATLTFDTINDSTDEDDSEVVVSLHVRPIPDGVTIGEPSIAYVTVLDDD